MRILLPRGKWAGAIVIYVVDRSNRKQFASQLEQMYRIRHRIYVEGRGWRALQRDDGREIDEFDTAHAVYLLGLDENGDVTAGTRLIPTTRPHLMRDVFAHAVTLGDIPDSESVYEWTRYFLTHEPTDRAARRRQAGELLCAMFEFGLAQGLTHFSLVCDTFFLPMFYEARWNITLLGSPTAYDEGTCIALLFEASREALLSTREVRGVTGPVLTKTSRPPRERVLEPA